MLSHISTQSYSKDFSVPNWLEISGKFHFSFLPPKSCIKMTVSFIVATKLKLD